MSGTARLIVALLLTTIVALVECIGGFVAHSITLLSDSAHVAMDVLALAIALAARAQSTRPATPRQTYGFARMEVLAALGNGALLFTITAFIVVEAVHRLQMPELPNGAAMAMIAACGLVVNGIVALTLVLGGEDGIHHRHGHTHAHAPYTAADVEQHAQEHHGSHYVHHLNSAEGRSQRSSLNMRAALLHVAGDALGGIAAIIGGIVVYYAHIAWLDPVLSIVVAAIIILGIFHIVRDAIDVLLESAPSHADTDIVRAHLLEIPGIIEVHDLHVWTLSGVDYLLSAHVVLADRRISEASMILQSVEASLRATYMITHVTIQFECRSCEVDQRIICTQRKG